MSIDRIRAGIVEGMRSTPEVFFDEGWRLATDDERAGAVCRPDDIVFATPAGFRRLPLWLDEVPAKTANVRVLDDPDREAKLADLRVRIREVDGA